MNRAVKLIASLLVTLVFSWWAFRDTDWNSQVASLKSANYLWVGPYFVILTDAAGRCIPGARIIVVPQQRHIWPADDPRSFEVALRAFLASQ